MADPVKVLGTQVKQVKVEDLKSHPDNAREGDIDAIVQSFRSNGFYGALIVQRETGYILAGNHRWQAAKRLGMTTVPVMYVDVDDTEAKRILLADNRSSDVASYDDRALVALLKSLPDLTGTGYSSEDLDKLLPKVIEGPVEREPLGVPFEQTWFLVRVPIDDHAKVAKMLEAVDELDDVEVLSSHN